jgi:hypothetical protein
VTLLVWSFHLALGEVRVWDNCAKHTSTAIMDLGPHAQAFLKSALHLRQYKSIPYVVPPRCLDDILRCGVYGTFALAYHGI